MIAKDSTTIVFSFIVMMKPIQGGEITGYTAHGIAERDGYRRYFIVLVECTWGNGGCKP